MDESVDRYRNSLIEKEEASAKTINRRLSSIRKYLEFGNKEGFVKNANIITKNLKVDS